MPLIIIVLGMIDFGKAAISNDEKAITHASGSLIRRFIAGIVIFFVPTIVGVLTKNVLSINIENEFFSCTSCMFNPGECREEVKLLIEQEKNEENESYDGNNLLYDSLNSHTNSVNGIKYKLYNQSDSRWGSIQYPSGKTISDIGCMISAVAVLSSAYNVDITPKTVFESNYRHSWPHDGVNFFSNNEFSCITKQPINYTDIKSSLKDGEVAIIKVEANSPFTNSQHYMSLIDINKDGSKIFVGNSYGLVAGAYNRDGWFDSNILFNDVHELYICKPSENLINKFN